MTVAFIMSEKDWPEASHHNVTSLDWEAGLGIEDDGKREKFEASEEA